LWSSAEADSIGPLTDLAPPGNRASVMDMQPRKAIEGCLRVWRKR
jgi:hypothetical protein